MFEDSDDDENVKAVTDIDELCATVTTDAADLNQLLRRACAYLGGSQHQRADQCVGILIVNHCTRLLPTLWTVLLQKLKECDSTPSKVSVVAHFSNLCDRIAARQRSEAFRVFAREASVLFTQIDVVADRRFVRSCVTIFAALGIHAHAEATAILYDKLVLSFFKWTRQDAKRNSGTLLVALCRWTPMRTVADAVYENRDNGDRPGVALLFDTAVPSILQQSALLHVDPSTAPEIVTLCKYANGWMLGELTASTSAVVVASVASALAKMSDLAPISDVVAKAAQEALLSNPKPMLVCPLLQLVRASKSDASVNLDLAAKFAEHSDPLIRQNAFDLLGVASVATGRFDETLKFCVEQLNDRLVKARCSITIKGIFNCIATCLPMVDEQSFAVTASRVIHLFNEGESRGGRLPSVREQLLGAIEKGLQRYYATILDDAAVVQIARFAARNESLLGEPASASISARILLALPQAFCVLSPLVNAAFFSMEAATMPRPWFDDAGESCQLMFGGLLNQAEKMIAQGTANSIGVGLAILRELTAILIDDEQQYAGATAQYIGVVSTILTTLNSPAAASVESIVLLLRALSEVLPLGPEEDALADAFRMVWTMLRRCTMAVEPPAPTVESATPASPVRRLVPPATRTAGTLLEEIRLVDEIGEGIDAAARIHQSTSESSSTVFRELLGELLQALMTICRAAHGFFRDALQLQIMPVMANLELAALLQPAASVDCARVILASLFSDCSTVVSSERVNAEQRRVKVVQSALPTIQRALAFDLHVIGTELFAFMATVMDCDVGCTAPENSCYLAMDAECGMLKRLSAIALEDRSYSFVHGPAVLTSLTFMLRTVQATYRPGGLLPEETLQVVAQTLADVKSHSNLFHEVNGGDSFAIIFGDELPRSRVPVCALRALAYNTDRLVRLLDSTAGVNLTDDESWASALSTVIDSVELSALSSSAGPFSRGLLTANGSSFDHSLALHPKSLSAACALSKTPRATAELIASSNTPLRWDTCSIAFRIVNDDRKQSSSATHPFVEEVWKRSAQRHPIDKSTVQRWFRQGNWNAPLFGETAQRDDADRRLSAVAVALQCKSMLYFEGGSEPPIAATWRTKAAPPRTGGSSSNNNLNDIFSFASTAAPRRDTSTFIVACDVMPFAGALLAALPLNILEKEYEHLRPYHVLEALRYVSTAEELELWLAAAAALGENVPGHWANLIILQAARRCLSLMANRTARADNIERTSAIVEFLATTVDPPPEVAAAIAILVEWLKPDRMGFWCWDDAWAVVPSDLRRAVLRCIALSVGLPATLQDAAEPAIAKRLAEMMLRYDRDDCPFADSALLNSCRCLSGNTAAAFLHHDEIPLANPRVFNAVTEFIYTVGLNTKAALEFHSEISPMLLDPTVASDVDFRDAVMRCCTALIVSLGEDRRSRPPTHTATADLQALYSDYPLKRMSTEGAEVIFDAVHDATFAPWARADLLVRHWNQYRRPNLSMSPAENTVEPQDRDRLCTSILNLIVPLLQKLLSPTADTQSVWGSLSLVQLLATKCAGALRKAQMMQGTAAKNILTSCVAFTSSQLSDQLKISEPTLKIGSSSVQLSLSSWCGLPTTVDDNDFYDTAAASSLLMVFSAGLRTNLDSEEVKAATKSAVVVRSTIRNDWLNLGPGLCALNGFASGPKADQAIAAKFYVDKVATLIDACNKAPGILSSSLLQIIRTAFAFTAAMPYETFVPDLAKVIWNAVATNNAVQSLRVKAYAHFVLQSTIGMQAVSSSVSSSSFSSIPAEPNLEAIQWSTIRSNLQENKLYSLEAALENQGAAFGLSVVKSGATASTLDCLLVTTTKASFLLRALGTNVEGDEKDRTMSSVIDLHAALRTRHQVDAPTCVVVLRLLKEAMPATERMFLALNQFRFTDIGLAGAVDALESSSPADTAELLSHLNLFINCVAQHAHDEGDVWWIATVMIWMSCCMVDPHLHRALGRCLTTESTPAARREVAQAASRWLCSERAALHRSVVAVFDHGMKGNNAAASSTKRMDAWRAVAAGLRA